MKKLLFASVVAMALGVASCGGDSNSKKMAVQEAKHAQEVAELEEVIDILNSFEGKSSNEIAEMAKIKADADSKYEKVLKDKEVEWEAEIKRLKNDIEDLEKIDGMRENEHTYFKAYDEAKK